VLNGHTRIFMQDEETKNDKGGDVNKEPETRLIH
jgi:hypothetical protein